MTARPFNVLFVCAGNTARSPFAAECAREHLAHVDPEAWRVGSAGTSALEGSPVPQDTLALASKFRYDLSTHRARNVTAPDIEGSDLVVAMAWDQVSHVWSLVPDSWGRCFTLKEFVHYARRAPSRPAILFADASDRMRDRVQNAHELRRRARTDHGFWGGLRPQDLDLPLPNGGGPDAWKTFATAVRLLVADSMRLIAPPAVSKPARDVPARSKANAGAAKKAKR